MMYVAAEIPRPAVNNAGNSSRDTEYNRNFGAQIPSAVIFISYLCCLFFSIVCYLVVY